MKKILHIHFAFLLLVFSSCQNKEKEQGTKKIDWEKDGMKWGNHYAQGFSIEEFENYYRISIIDPQSRNIYGKYVLYPADGEKPVLNADEGAIAYPIKNFSSTSTTHLPFLKLLDEQDKLIGFAGQKFVLDPTFISLFKKNEVIELGADNSLNNEKLIELFPDIFMVYPFGSLNFKTIIEADIPVFYNTDYLELHPLGKAEWIRVFGLLFDKKEKSEELFSGIEERYAATKKLTDSIEIRPEVFTGTIQSGTWYVPGGKSFQSVFLNDAGADYVWKDDEHNNSLALAPEVVIDKCVEAEFWVLVSSSESDFSLFHLENINSIYSEFSAFKNENVIFCNSNFTDYFGMGVVEPDELLKDLVHFFHPDVLKNHSPKYFHRLK